MNPVVDFALLMAQLENGAVPVEAIQNQHFGGTADADAREKTKRRLGKQTTYADVVQLFDMDRSSPG